MRITVCLTDTRPESWIEGLRAALPDAEVSAWTPDAPPADHAVVWAPPQAFLDQQPRLRGVFNIGAGVDALTKLRLPPEARIVRLDDAGMSVQMAEYVCHALIRHFRDFDGYAADAREGRWSYRKPHVRQDFPVGVMGLGVLGQRVAKAVAQFDFPVNGWSRSPKQIEGVQCFAGHENFDAFLAASRVLVCLLPLTPDTRGILRRETLLKLHGGQPGGYIINVARGGHLVEADLIPLLDDGPLAGATLDVFEAEPLPADHPFWRHPKISVTPHASARTQREESIAQIAGKIRAVEAGGDFDRIAGVVDPKRGY
ncbi:2-hydroxyacid dehydrogenase [Variovorax boronicumulans]|uniref:2-hydroxyacid dehydrogenase n=1 Tax=Variovorax boronicumulans TaxID=436515 RepID=UPI001C55D3D8